MYGIRQLFGEDGVDLALAGDPALSGKTRSHDLKPEMGLLAAPCAGVVTGMAMRIVVNRQALGFQGGFELHAYALGNPYGRHSEDRDRR